MPRFQPGETIDSHSKTWRRIEHRNPYIILSIISNTPIDREFNLLSTGVFDIFNRAMMRASMIAEPPSFLVPPFALKSMNCWAIGIFVYIHSAKSI